MIVHINLIMIFLILFSSTFYFAIKFFFEKKLSRFYIDFFQSLPSGGIILDEHFDIIDCNAFIGSLFNKSSQNNLDTFIDKPTIIKTIQRKKKKLELKLENNVFICNITEHTHNDTLLYYILFIPFQTYKATEMTYSTHSSEENIKIMSSHLVKRLNSPLNSIKNIYHKLTTSSSIEYLKNLKTPLIFEIEHINKTISDFDSYSKAIKLNLENSNINSLIADIEDKINEIYNGYDIHISKILVSTQMISLDPVKFKQVLMNLFVNAIESMQDNKLNIIIKSQQDEHSLSIHFIDNGSGINDEDQEKLFVPFYTTKPDNVGLGLPYCQKIISEHQGKITYKKTPNNNTCFTITLPYQLLKSNQEINNNKKKIYNFLNRR